MARTFFSVLETPIGELVLRGDGQALTGVFFGDGPKALAPRADWRQDDHLFGAARQQLTAYFARELTRFDLVLAPGGTPFQSRVWHAVSGIPYGGTTTYGKVANQLGDPKACRAVGLANGRNPIPIVIPCHRVLGADGGLTGYGGGVHRKQWLLALEGRGLDR